MSKKMKAGTSEGFGIARGARMITHPIPAAPWQLGRSLELILLPLVPEPVKHRVTWSWSGAKGQHIDWMDGETPDDIRLLMALKWQVGDRLYLQEPWCEVDGHYFTQSTTPEAEHLGWQPAHTMPEAAATHWYAIADVRVCQCSSINPADYVNTGLVNMDKITNPLDLAEECRAVASRWNTAHPDYPWASDLWVVVLAVEAIAP